MTKQSHGNIRVGIAGWKYEPWRGNFYPKGLVQKARARICFARSVPCISRSTAASIDVNRVVTSYARWYAETPDDFVFSLKAPKRITHELRLRDVAQPITHFLTSGPFELRQKLGPILWQFPPNFKFDPALFEPFLAMLPHDTEAAFEMARKHDKKHS